MTEPGAGEARIEFGATRGKSPERAVDRTDLTVAIPTYNGESRLPGLLEALRQQVVPPGVSWEVLVVDNCSTDQTAGVVRAHQERWRQNVALRLCREERPGTAFARQRAIREALGEVVGLLDDDNLPEPEWIASAWESLAVRPRAGAVASRIRGQFGAEPPAGFERIASFLGITERGDEAALYSPSSKQLPPAAGLAVRRCAWLDAVVHEPRLTGPVGARRGAGEDLEAMLAIQRAGWEIWYEPRMVTRHSISADRLTPERLLEVARAAGLAAHPLRRLRWPRWFVPVGTLAAAAKDLAALLGFRFRRGAAGAAPIVVECELAYLEARLRGVLSYQRGGEESRALKGPREYRR